MVLVLGIVKASLEILGIGIGVKKVVLLMSVLGHPHTETMRRNTYVGFLPFFENP